MDSLAISAAERSPALHVRVNPTYALYHYLVREAQRRPDERHPATREAAALMQEARTPLGLHGHWDSWEQPLAAGDTVGEATRGLREAMASTADQLGAALARAERPFRDALWPRRLPLVEEALLTLRERLAPHFPAMARRQAETFGFTWPPRIDAFLVTDCYDRPGAYSHPLTVDVAHNTGLELCETVLHEATHVGDVHTNILGGESLQHRLIAHLEGRGLSFRKAWDVWHAVIFASSARQVRAHIAPGHTDYALPRDLYARFGVPELPRLWEGFAAGAMDEPAFFAAVGEQVCDPTERPRGAPVRSHGAARRDG